MEQLYGNPLDVWRAWASDVRGVAIDSGHHVAEDNPRALVAALIDYLAETS